MTWLAWRQFRVQAAAGAAVVALIAIFLLLTGPGLSNTYADGLAQCGGDCRQFADAFLDEHQATMLEVTAIILVLPAILGLFWGAPLVSRELDAGTHRLAWTQSVTRSRWLAVKLLLVGVAVAAVSGLVTWAVDWWSDPLDAAGAVGEARLPWSLTYAAHGVVPVAYALFAFTLGVAVGILTRRPLPAMAITLAVFLAFQIAIPLTVRPHLVSPVTTSAAITADTLANFNIVQGGNALTIDANAPEPGSWLISRHLVDGSGRPVTTLPGYLIDRPDCAPAKDVSQCLSVIAGLGYRQVSTYHPPSHFWPLQRAEAGLYVGLSAVLAGFCFWWIRRRVT
jgi:ABC-type transport system involved in multi-copper enzyme maturation permease subunit